MLSLFTRSLCLSSRHAPAAFSIQRGVPLLAIAASRSMGIMASQVSAPDRVAAAAGEQATFGAGCYCMSHAVFTAIHISAAALFCGPV